MSDLGKSGTLTAPPGDRALAGQSPPLDVARVLREKLIRIAFQPIVTLASKEVVGYEALARFPSEEVISPAPWFAAAAEQGLEADLEVAAIAGALRQFGRLPNNVFVALNLSPLTVADPVVRKLLATVDAKRVVLEIKEHATEEACRSFSSVFREMRAAGVRIAVDDAGMSAVNFRQILEVEPDILKIDVDIIQGIDRDSMKQAVVSAFSTLAERSNALSLAEGIETEEELAMLRSLNISAGQGYFFGRPEMLPDL